MEIKDYYISTDNSKLNSSFIWKYLSEKSYWAKGRTLEEVEKTIEHSFCIGVYDKNDEQVGFARLISDRVVFAWIVDVFVAHEHRGNSLGKMMLEFIVSHPDFKNVRAMALKTADAHELYKKYGFRSLSDAEMWMERKNIIIK